jgi:hypothetical protein
MSELRALTMLNEAGDLTVVWEEQNDDAMEAHIQKRMDAGCIFFIIEPRFGGLVAPSKRKLERATDAHKYRALAVPDEEVAKFVAEGKAEVVATPAQPVKKSRVSRSAKEVAKKESVGIAPRKGG